MEASEAQGSKIIPFMDGDILVHKKGKYYRVLHATARHSEDMSFMVVYQELYGAKNVWVRPCSMFTADRFQIAVRSEDL